MKTIQNLLRKQFFEDKKGLAIYAITVAGVLFGLILLRAFTQNTSSFSSSYYADWFGNLLFLGGFIITSLTFEDMHSKAKQHTWLMLPAHPVHRIITKVIYLGILYPIALMIFLSLASLGIEGLSSLLFGRSASVFTPFTRETWVQAGTYFVLQSVFLLGAAYFNSAHFIKTVLALAVLSISIGLITMLLLRLIYAPYFSAAFQDPYFFDRISIVLRSESTPLIRALEYGAKIGFWGLLAPFCWVVTYYRLREKEADNAV
ncbi:MAG: hypothetical protein ACQEQU_05860 [Spirochaetota bacterium]